LRSGAVSIGGQLEIRELKLEHHIGSWCSVVFEFNSLIGADHKRPFVGVSQGTVLGFGDGFGAILRGTVAKR